MRALLDSSVLIALAVAEHEHHEAAEGWIAGLNDGFATCPITQGVLMRIVTRSPDGSADQAADLLRMVVASDRHQFWPDEISYTEVPTEGLSGHQQLTDAYLAQLARHRRGRLGTFDQAFAALHSDVAELVPTS